MGSSRPEFVTDANVLIDLHTGGVLAAVSRMPQGFCVPDVVVAEMDEPDEATVVRAGFRQESLPGEAVTVVMRLVGEDRHISIQDASGLVLAQRTGRVLLTGEKRLRELAVRIGVKVHGTLWLLEQMVAAAVLTSRQAADALERMLECGRRLPESEARGHIERWRAGREAE